MLKSTSFTTDALAIVSAFNEHDLNVPDDINIRLAVIGMERIKQSLSSFGLYLVTNTEGTRLDAATDDLWLRHCKVEAFHRYIMEKPDDANQ